MMWLARHTQGKLAKTFFQANAISCRDLRKPLETGGGTCVHSLVFAIEYDRESRRTPDQTLKLLHC